MSADLVNASHPSLLTVCIPRRQAHFFVEVLAPKRLQADPKLPPDLEAYLLLQARAAIQGPAQLLSSRLCRAGSKALQLRASRARAGTSRKQLLRGGDVPLGALVHLGGGRAHGVAQGSGLWEPIQHHRALGRVVGGLLLGLEIGAEDSIWAAGVDWLA